MGFGKRLFVVDIGRRALATTHLKVKRGMVELSPLEVHRIEKSIPKEAISPQKGEAVLLSLRDEFFEFFSFELPPASPKELKPLVAHRCRQHSTPQTLVGAKLAGQVKDSRGLPKEKLVVGRVNKEMVSKVISALDIQKNRFLGAVPRSEMILSSVEGIGLKIPPPEEAFCTVEVLRSLLAFHFFRGREFLFSRSISLQEEMSPEEKAQRVAMEFVQTNLYMNQRYRLECNKVFVGGGELEKTPFLEMVKEGTGKETIGICSAAEPYFSRLPTAGEFMLGGANWLITKKPHERLLILPTEVKQFYRSRKISTVALTAAGTVLVAAVLSGLGMSNKLHNLKKKEWELRNKVLEEKGSVKVLKKGFPTLEQWKALRELGEVNPGSPPIQQILAALSDASIPQSVLTSCQIERNEAGKLILSLEGEIVSPNSYTDALQKGRIFINNIKRELKKFWPDLSVEEVTLIPREEKKKDNDEETTSAASKSYLIDLSAKFLLEGDE